MRQLRYFLIFLVTVFLSACGGGGGGDTSDGGGSSGDGIDLAQYAGTYRGTITATVTTDAGSQTLERDLVFRISTDGRTLTVENQEFTLNSNSFQATIALPLQGVEVTCTLNATIFGDIEEGLISGTVEGDGDCVQGGEIVKGKLSGYYSATSNQ
jgi:hypothetical protein